MNETKDTAPADKPNQRNSFPVPFTLDEFRQDILVVHWHCMHLMDFVTVTPPEGKNVLDFEDLAYEQIRSTAFSRYMEELYEFAYLGRLADGGASLSREGDIAFVCAVARDAAGAFANEWDSFERSPNIRESALRCIQVAELASARNTLEGNESFDNWGGDDISWESALSIKQMALLAGMEEMSIRAAANPKRGDKALRTYTEDGSTRIEIGVAKAWLQAKGRYVPITSHWTGGNIDLTTQRYTAPGALAEALNTRYGLIARYDAQTINNKLASIGVPLKRVGTSEYLDIEHLFSNESAMRQLAEVLELPADLLVLRVQEMLATQRLTKIRRELDKATFVKSNTNI